MKDNSDKRARLIEQYAATHNYGVRTGDFARLAALLHPAAEFVFFNIPAGPFIGRAAITAAFAAQPPTDELRLTDIAVSGTEQRAAYGWRRAPHVAEGVLIIRVREGLIERIEVRRNVTSASADA